MWKSGRGMSGGVGNLTDVVGSGRQFFITSASGRVESTVFSNIAGQVESGQDKSKYSPVGLGRVTRADPTRLVKFDVTGKRTRKTTPPPRFSHSDGTTVS